METASQLDYLLIERALSGVLPLDQLNSEEKDFCHKYKPVFDIGRLAHRIAQGYYAHILAIEVARDPRSKELISTIPEGEAIPIGYVFRRDGTKHTYSSQYYIDYLNSPAIVDDLARTWLVSSLLAVGDALSAYDYLNHALYLSLSITLEMVLGTATNSHSRLKIKRQRKRQRPV
jgi:hypothetical protein